MAKDSDVRRTGAGDPARTLALLWRLETPSARGPAQTRTLNQVVDAAVDLADDRELAAVTMRALATHLRIAPMSIYTYVPGKAELLDLMLDAIYVRMPRPPWRTRDWRRRVRRLAAANRDLLRRHPWAAGLGSLARPPLGPGVLAKYEYELSAFDGTALSDVDLDAALGFVLGFVHAQARAEQDHHRAAEELTDEQWWAASAPLLARLVDAADFPRATRVGEAAGSAQGSAYDPDRAWTFGLGRVLDGLGAIIDR